MAAMVIILTAQLPVCIRIAARADHVMHPGAISIETIPIEGVVSDRCHGSQVGETAPHPVTGTQVGPMQRAGLTAAKQILVANHCKSV